MHVPALQAQELNVRDRGRIGRGSALSSWLRSWLLAPYLGLGPQNCPAAQTGHEYPAYDDHPAEHVTIAADPCDDPKQCSFFRLEYIQHGLLPVRVIISNESDQALSLDDARIHFLPGQRRPRQAATEDDINRRLFTIHSTQPTHIPLTPIKIHHAPVDKKITDGRNDFGVRFNHRAGPLHGCGLCFL